MIDSFNRQFEGKTVLVTGHTGFKGSWLALWLCALGARVVGYSLPPATEPSHFTLCKLREKIVHIEGDIRDYKHLADVVQEHRPEIIFHLAAQPIVLHGYENPKYTFDTNVGGTVNVLEAARFCDSLRALLVVTTDKCYENNEWDWGYRETDRLGGKDPYSSSKSMAELATASYRDSFFTRKGPGVATARAGNVIGGGDFSTFRIVPDTMRALMNKEPVLVRNPDSVRPWLYVLDSLSGYLWLASQLAETGQTYAEAWNFGPLEQQGVSVKSVVKEAIECWGEGEWRDVGGKDAPREMGTLKLNREKAAARLNWQPVYSIKEALCETVSWYKAYQKVYDLGDVGLVHIERYTRLAQQHNLMWARPCNLFVRP